MAKQDKSTRDIRSRLKEAGIKPLKYTVGIGKLFIQGSGTNYFNNNMPAAAAMYETNQDLLKDTVKFLRNPADAIKRQVDRALGSEDFKAVKRLVTNAVDDLKTGNFYDATRDRSEFGSSVDALLGDFGGFDMDGFDENGDWGEIDVDPSVDAEVKIAQAQEDSDAKRTEATISAVGTATEAIINNDNNNARDRLKMSVKQHSQSMMAMQNLLTSSTATFEMMNNNMKVMTSVVSEASAQIISGMGEIKSLLTEIRDGVVPKTVSNEYKEPNTVFDSNGALNIREYLKNVLKNAKEKTNLDMLSMATGGFSISQLVDLYADNPWQIISDSMFKKLIPATLQKTIETFNKSLENFFPALLTKLFTRGKEAEGSNGSIKDLIAGMFGFKARSSSSINPDSYDYLGKAVFTNKFTKSVEEVIPMWLSRIDSHISGNPLQAYNYRTGKLENVSKVIAKNEHGVKDLVGRMGDSQYEMFDRVEALQFRTDKEKDEFKSYVYKFLQKNAEENNFINPRLEKNDFIRTLMPTTSNEELYYNLLMGILNSMPRGSLMQMSKDIMEARSGRDRYNKSLNEELQKSGLMASFSGWLDPDLAKRIQSASTEKRLGLSDDQLDELITEYNAKNKSGITATKENTNSLLMNIANILKSGIITFSYDMKASPVAENADPELVKLYQRAKARSDEYTKALEQAEKDKRDARIRAMEREDEQRRRHRDLLTIENFDGSVITENTLAADVEDSLRNADIKRMSKAEADARAKADPRFAAQYKEYRDKLKDKANELGDKTGVNGFLGKAKEYLNAPFKLVERSLNIMDGLMFKFLYGDDMDVELAGTNEHYLISSMSNLFKAQFANIRDWFTKHIGDPLKKYLFDKDDGVLSEIRNFLGDKVVTPIKESIFGKKNDQGYYSGGIFSDKLNSAKWKIAEVKSNFTKSGKKFEDYAIDQAKGAINKILYGDHVAGKGKGFVQDVDDDGNIISSVEYGGIIGMFKSGFQKFREFMLGPDWDTADPSKKLWEDTKIEVKKALPGIGGGALLGAGATLGMGLFSSLWLPGGPIMGAMLGSVAGFINSSDRFKDWVFGEEEIDENGKVTRKGALISKEVQEGFKKYAPKVAAGAAIGSIAGNMGLLPFGMGPIISGILGSMGGMIVASDRMKELIFGKLVDEYDENGNKTGRKIRDDSGLIPNQWKENIKKALPGAAIGALGGTIVGGLIPGIAMLPGGPILGGLAGLAVSLSGDKIEKFLFGNEEDELDDDGKKTGKKVRKGGVFGRMFNFGRDKIVEPFFRQLDTWGKSIGDWFNESVITPLSNSVQPFRDAMKSAADNIRESLSNIGQSIKDSINNVFEKFVGKPLGEFFEEKIINPMKSMLSKIFGGIGKLIGGIISAPFKAMEFVLTGNVSGKQKEDEKIKESWIDKLFGRTPEQQEERERVKREKEAHRINQRKLRAAKWKQFKETLASRFGFADTDLDEQSNISDETWFTHYGSGWSRYVGKDGRVYYIDKNGKAYRADSRSTASETNATTNNKTVDSNENETKSNEEKAKPTKPSPMKMPDDYDPSPYAYQNHGVDYNSPGSKVPAPGEKPKKKTEDNNTEDASTVREELKKAKEASDNSKAKSESSDDSGSDSKTAAKPEQSRPDKKFGRKTSNEYLAEITKYTKKIHSEISGQLGGSGWNLAYIKVLLEKKFGMELSPEELPEGMEGSKKVKKRRGIFGKAKDAIGGFLTGAAGIVSEGISRIWDFITAPFRMLAKVVNGIVDAGTALIKGIGGFLGSLGGFLKDTLFKTLDVVTTGLQEGAKTILHTAGAAITGAVDFLAGAAKGLGATLGNLAGAFTGVLKNFAITATGVLKDFTLAATSVLGGVVRTIATVAPDVIAGLWHGATGIAKGLWHGAKGLAGLLGRGALGIFRKITGKGKEKVHDIGTFKLAGGFIDKINEGIPIKVGEGVKTEPFPYVSLAGGIFKAKPSIAIPVYLAGLSEETRKEFNSSGIQSSPQDNNLKSSDTAESNPSAPSATPVAPDSNNYNVKDYVKAYKSADNKVNKAKDPKKAYDNIMDNAKSEEDIEALKTVKDLNDINSNYGGYNKSSSNKKKKSKESSGFLETILSLFGPNKNGGIFNTIKNVLAGTTIGKIFSKIGGKVSGFFGKAAGVLKTGATGILGTALHNLPFLMGTYNAFASGDNERVGLNFAKQAPKVGNWVVKSAESAADIITSPTPKTAAANAGVAAKVLAAVRTALTKFLNNKAVTAVAKKIAGVDTGRIATMLLNRFDTILMKLGSAAAKQLLKKINIVVLVATAVYDFGTGMYRAGEYFEVEDDDVTLGMRFSAGIAKAASGIMFGLLPIGWAAQSIYKIFANKETEAELSKKQDKLKEKVKAYNAENGTNYSVDDYKKNVKKVDKDTGYTKLSLGEKVKNFFGVSNKLDTSKIVKTKSWDVPEGYVKVKQRPPSKYKPKKIINDIGTVSSWIISEENLNAWAEESGVKAKTGKGRSNDVSFGKGPKETIFSQTDPRWNREDPTMKDAGCGPTVAAMMASRLGRGVNPAEASELAYAGGYRDSSGGTNPDFFKAYGAVHGVSMQEGPTDKTSIMSSLNTGKPVALMGQGGAYGSGSHYLLADSANGNSVSLVDPIGGRRFKAGVSAVANNTTAAIYSGRGRRFSFGRGVINSDDTVMSGFVQQENDIKDAPPDALNGTGRVNLWGRGGDYRNGMVYYNQADSRWAKHTTGGSCTIGKAGCVISSLAMCVSQIAGKAITPPDIVEKYSYTLSGGGMRWDMMTKVAGEFGGEMTALNSKDAIISALKAGKPVLIYGEKRTCPICDYSDSGQKSGPHCVVIASISSDGKSVKVNDPGKQARCDKTFSVDKIRGFKCAYAASKGGKGVAGKNVSFSAIDDTTSSSDSTSSGNTGLAGLLDKFDTKFDLTKGLSSITTKVGNVVNKLFGYKEESADSESTSSDTSSSSSKSSFNPTGDLSKYINNPSNAKEEMLGLTMKRTIDGESGGDYAMVTADDNGSYSVGLVQEHGPKSQRMFTNIANQLSDPSLKAKATKFASMYNRALSKSEAADMRAFLLNPTVEPISKKVQDAQSLEEVSSNLNVPFAMYDDGVLKDPRSGVIVADIGNTGPAHLTGWRKKYTPTDKSQELAHVRDSLKSSDSWWGRAVNNKYYRGWMNRIDNSYNDLKNYKTKFGAGPGLKPNVYVPGKMDATPYTADRIFGTGSVESNTSTSLRSYITSFTNTIKKIRESAERDRATDRIVSSIENVTNTIKSNTGNSNTDTLTTLVSTIGTALGQMVTLLESIKSNTEQQVAAATTAGATSTIPTVRANNTGSRNVGSDIIDKLTSK